MIETKSSNIGRAYTPSPSSQTCKGEQGETSVMIEEESNYIGQGYIPHNTCIEP
jgi:hypothetical protein